MYGIANGLLVVETFDSSVNERTDRWRDLAEEDVECRGDEEGS